MKIKKTNKKNFQERLKLFGEQIEENQAYDVFDNILDDLLNEDFFGTEGQCDPRGDQRG